MRQDFPPEQVLAPADIHRLAGLRWLSLAAMAVALGIMALLPGVRLPVPALLGVMSALTAANLFSLAWLARGVPPGQYALLGQLAIDLMAWAIFVYFSGGAANPLISLFLPLVAIGAAILPAGQAWLLAAAAVMAYSLLWRYYLPLQIANDALAARWHLAGMWLTFLLSAAVIVGFVVSMNAALRRRDTALAAAHAAMVRNEKVVALGNLAAGTAHNLGTPLGTMQIVIDDLLQDTAHAGALHEDLEELAAQITQCRHILGLLTAEAGNARAEGGGRVRVDQWLQETIGRWQAQRPGHKVDVRCPTSASTLEIIADTTLGQALHTLINNAADAHGTSPDVIIELDAHLTADHLQIDVMDRGPGMSALQRSQAGRSPTPSSRGMGIGLFLARSAVERCGGALRLDARDGGGTIARIQIPLATLQIDTPE